MTTPAAPPPPTSPRAPRRTQWLVVLALGVGLGVGAAVTGVVASRGDDSAVQRSAAQLSDVQASCRGWMGSSDGEGSDPAWCTDMFAWMTDSSDGSMMGSMMWQDSTGMATACRDWVEKQGGSQKATDLQRCTDMVQWMDERMPSQRGRWMMDDGSS